jgi:hypothetical protein
MFNSFNLHSVVYFPKRTNTRSSTMIDNIFLNLNKFQNYTISPMINWLADHDAQFLSIHFANFNSNKISNNAITIR